MNNYSFSVIVEKEGSLYSALCPEIDIASQGKNVDEALANLQEAVQLYLESADPSELQALPTEPPFLTTLNITVAA